MKDPYSTLVGRLRPERVSEWLEDAQRGSGREGPTPRSTDLEFRDPLSGAPPQGLGRSPIKSHVSEPQTSSWRVPDRGPCGNGWSLHRGSSFSLLRPSLPAAFHQLDAFGPSPSTECQTILSAQPSALHTPSSCLLCPLSSWAPSDGITGVHRCQAPSLLFYRWEAEAQPAGGIGLRSPWETGWTAQESRALRPGLHSCLPLGIPSPSPCVTGGRGNVAVPSSWLPPHCLPASSSSLRSCHSPRVGVEGWNCTGRLGWWEVLLGSEPGGGTATYIGFCSGYFGRWRSPRPAAPSPSGVRYSPTMVLGVCITFARPGPIKPGLLITLGPCPPPAPKAEAQAGLFSSAKTSMTSLDGSDVSVLQNPARKGREKASRRMGQELSSTHGAGPGSSVHSIFSLQPHSAGLVPRAWMGRQHKDVRCYVTYYSKPGPGAGSGSSSFIR